MRSSTVRDYFDRIDLLSQLVKQLRTREKDGKVFTKRSTNYRKLIVVLRAEFLKCAEEPCAIRKQVAIKYLHQTTDDAKHLIKHGLTKDESKISSLREWRAAMKQQ